MDNSKKKQWTVVLVALILLLFTGIIAINDTQAKFLHYWHAWFGEESSPPEKNPETDKDSEQENDPEPESEAPPTNSTEKEEAKQDPIIYVGQQLTIPLTAGENAVSSAQVITTGLVDGNQKQIALTFDAGWLYDQTEDLLAVLDNYQVKSTFFMRALWVENHPELAQLIKNKGHIIENHSLTHGHLTNMTDQEIKNEIVSATTIIQKVTGSKTSLFRPPYGEYNSRLLKLLAEAGYPYAIMWTVDSHDWAEEIGGQKVTTAYLVDRVLKNAANNGIILMHIGGYNTVEALPDIIEGLRQEGYQLVTVNEMLPPVSTNLVYTVQPGDTLYAISRRYGIAVAELVKANEL